MAWTPIPQQQQRGAQLPTAGGAPAEAVRDRGAQDHELADVALSPTGEPAQGADYPADEIANKRDDNTPTAREPHVNWDDVVQPEGHARQAEPEAAEARRGDLPLPDGK